MTPGRCCRALRAAMFAATCVLLASLGHLLMSGAAVPWRAVAAALAVTGAVAWVLAGRERGLLAVTSATVAVQAVLHTGFSLAQALAQAAAPSRPEGVSVAQQWAQYLLCGPTARLSRAEAVRVVRDAGLGSRLELPPPGEGGHAHHAAHAMADAGTAMTTVPMPAGHDMGSMSPTGMLAAHLLAALLCGLWLAYGEQGTFRVLRAVAGLLLVPLRLAFRLPAPPDRPRLGARRGHRSRPPRGFLLVHAITSRGPPAGTAVI
ncbi:MULTISPECIES: hypothetical protein [unclassified Streptomyces]|uniref:hypothetical protein n=1 Tax=unclassified Streptomyces TaxID=2593676 RepID=UPI0022525F6A|nr:MULTISPECIES: hypothetical protein [unclassified Streptomyces]MCX4524109.1 hypothetical protein [Streptomyces sp. NBC_01551]MCX4545373.1 hypothetical protein [Streptomyces sp. NBC_01565]